MRAAELAVDIVDAYSERETGGIGLSVSKVTLSAFRNYDSQRIVCGKEPVVLTGANGSGKTNLIEAISLLVPGKGLRRSSLADFQKIGVKEPWAVSIELLCGGVPVSIGTGKDRSCLNSEEEKRAVFIDGRPARSQNALSEHVVMAWITPEMDRLLSEGASVRRKFLDRLAFAFDPAHGGRVQRYEKAMRERLRLLREGCRDASWFSALEDEMARSAVAIAASRMHMISCLRIAMDEGGDVFPRADMEVRGTAEDMLEYKPALLVEDALRDAFKGSRAEDTASGTCATGAHRSDFKVSHRLRACPAELCSTGEQKALIISLMLAFVRLLRTHKKAMPLFLLDDIAAHLDEIGRCALFEEVLFLGGQAWFTGQDTVSFSSLKSKAQFFCVENGTVYG